MSDEDGPGRKTAYRIEYAASARAKCKGPKPCSGTPIAKGLMRIGTLVDIQGHQAFQWRHFGCTTAKLMGNILKNVGEIEELDGYEDLTPEDASKIKKAFDTLTIEPEDIPESARKPPADEDEDADGSEKPKPKAKRAPRKKPVKEEDDEEEEPPKKKRRAPAKKVKKEEVEEDDDEGGDPEDGKVDEDDDEEDVKPKKRAPKKAAPKAEPKPKKARTSAEKKKAVDDALADDGELTEPEDEKPKAGEKRKRAPTKKAGEKPAPKAAKAKPSSKAKSKAT
ncbi:zf-PARP-domain-containing protein [Calocera cornea HHB12733]|uniref:Zf-PARP-domain-containing protein n=1 Tax=Calocera cornea HHB12733 TaxID=1353952 RepID=A0A165DEB3_9BASI|nr:zf-PARP-domain-containing protein [Calocera cornea HHB12733]